MDAISLIENILVYGSKETSYKYALLLSITDYLIEHANQKPVNNLHFIPIWYITKQFAIYYYPLLNAGIPIYLNKTTNFIPEVEKAFTKLKEDVSSKAVPISFELTSIENTPKFYQYLTTTIDLPKGVVSFLQSIRKSLEQPISNIANLGKGSKSSTLPFFTLYSVDSELSIRAPQSEHLKNLKKNFDTTVVEKMNVSRFIAKEDIFLVFGSFVYQELSTYRFWLREVIIKRWVQEYPKFSKALFLSYFDYYKEIPERPSLKPFRDFYENELGITTCTYCDKPISGDKYHMDHLIPRSLFYVDRIWNLFPSCAPCNLSKKAKIIDLATYRSKIELLLEVVLQKLDKVKYERFWYDYDYLFEIYFASSFTFNLAVEKDRAMAIKSIMTYIQEVLEKLASQTVAELWKHK